MGSTENRLYSSFAVASAPGGKDHCIETNTRRIAIKNETDSGNSVAHNGNNHRLV